MVRSLSRIFALVVSALLVLAGVAFAQEPVPNPDDQAAYEQWVEEHRDQLPGYCAEFGGVWNVEQGTCEFDPTTPVEPQTEPSDSEPTASEPVVPAEPATPTPGAPTYTG